MDIAPVFHPTKSKYLVLTADFILPIFICLAITFLAYLMLYSSLFKISTVNCIEDYKDCEDPSLVIELNKLKGQNIFTLSKKAIISKLTSGDFTIRQADLIKKLPGTVNINIQSVYPVLALRVDGDPTWIVIDKKFRVIGEREIDPNVPTVLVPGPLTVVVGKTPEDELIIETFKLALRLTDELFEIKSIYLIDSNTIKLTLPEGRSALFSPKKDELVQLRALQEILSDDTIIQGVKIIDVRFSQPVLR
jgi:cell division septal protein FtsQ